MINHEIISELYYNETEKVRITGSPSLNRIKRMKSDDAVEELQALLNPQEKILLNKLLDQWMDMEVASNEESFISGFRLGAKLMDEILEKDSGLS